MRASTRAFGLFLVVILLGGCADQKGSTPEDSGQNTQASTPAAAAGSISGEVLETMDAGGYTYVRLDVEGKETWAAGPVTPMTVGNAVTVTTSMPMPGFRSESLDRTFDTLYFVNGFGDVAKADPHPGTMDSMGKDTSTMAGHGVTPTADVAAGSVTPVEGGHSVGALYGARASVAGTSTSVRGRVVKFNAGIMGKNWVHIQDGTGDPAAKTHDLLITTDARCAVGDLITATGTVAVDKDFGAGYSYELLLENASIEVDGSTTGR